MADPRMDRVPGSIGCLPESTGCRLLGMLLHIPGGTNYLFGRTHCGFWEYLCSAFINAVEVTFSIAGTSLSVSSRMKICLALVFLTNRSPGP